MDWRLEEEGLLERSFPQVRSEFTCEPWSKVKADGSVLRQYEVLPRSNTHHVLFHEVTHFSHPDPEFCDDVGRPLYSTMHHFILPRDDGWDHRPTLLIYEVTQQSRYRDRAPVDSEWPVAVRSAYHLLRTVRGAQVFQRNFICDDPLYRIVFRLEIAPRDRD